MPGGSKTPLGLFTKDLARMCAMGFAGPEMLTTILKVAEKAAEEEEEKVSDAAIQIVETAATVFPTMFEKVAPALLELYNGNVDSRLKTRLLQVNDV